MVASPSLPPVPAAVGEPALPGLAQARQLASLWDRLATQHVTMGCSCLMTGVSVSLADFERDIADYLWAESERLNQPAVARFLLACGPLDGQPHAVRDLLHRLEDDTVPPAVAGWLLPRLHTTLTSFARLHGGGDAALAGWGG